MKIHFLILFVFIQFSSFSQNFEEREKITSEFEKSDDIKIELFNIKLATNKLDSIQLNSNFLKRKNIKFKILAFKISGIDKNDKTLFSMKFWNNKIPEEFRMKLNDCAECKSIKVNEITINWFTGTYTLNSSQIWNIK
ncbi:hypothetical protein [Aquimarina sp. 2201CG5-10]|uniref:hypothetical protein n=1 Tax=Aquimarina callyspongiae TaxID=3098150 RepID=UPI002AB35E90|nr:hypothetical protein [Aquimarina sp. 2201CG5-10]MDY8135449.1 hypothetical protein [Aquimarina sp. 2201CG5-10]